jgi:3-isopropylmalate/(R)-2-methylmalate dehydratase small subunit
VDKLMEDAKKGENARLTVDLERQVVVRPDGEEIAFEIDSFRKHCLLNGLDDVALTLEKNAEIEDFEGGQKAATPWLYG